jgi:hypothetical protein
MRTPVVGLVLSGVQFVDAARRHRVASRAPIDHVVPVTDGSHLARLWANRAGCYPPDLPDRLVREALTILDRVEEGHLAVSRNSSPTRRLRRPATTAGTNPSHASGPP